jgi:hypothetical protein
MTIYQLLAVTKAIEHLEMAGCPTLSEDGVNKLIMECPNLKFIDMNANPAISYAYLDDIA